MIAQFSGHVPDEKVDDLLEAVLALPGVESAYKKPPALPAMGDSDLP